MKRPIPVTIYDLECTAKDASDGLASYRNLSVWYDDATYSFTYRTVNKTDISREDAIKMLAD